VESYNRLKLGKTIRYIVFKLAEDSKSIVVERESNNNDWEDFRENLVKARSKGGKGPRYAVYDFPYDSDDGARLNDTLSLAKKR
jgi:cofilin